MYGLDGSNLDYPPVLMATIFSKSMPAIVFLISPLDLVATCRDTFISWFQPQKWLGNLVIWKNLCIHFCLFCITFDWKLWAILTCRWSWFTFLDDGASFPSFCGASAVWLLGFSFRLLPSASLSVTCGISAGLMEAGLFLTPRAMFCASTLDSKRALRASMDPELLRRLPVDLLRTKLVLIFGDSHLSPFIFKDFGGRFSVSRGGSFI